jgi:hypothetical protein
MLTVQEETQVLILEGEEVQLIEQAIPAGLEGQV